MSFPQSLLPVKVEILINGTWQNITTYVQTRNETTPIVISAGKQSRQDTWQPARATMTLNNADGRFSPNYLSGAYYPYLQRNVQLRISLVNVTSSTNNVYSGYRFWGEVNSWPPVSDVSGQDVYVNITATGPMRRLRRGGGKGSALTRYYASLTGAFAPIAYWPCEDDVYSTAVGTALQGGTNITVTSGKPKWKADSSFDGSNPILIINRSVLTGNTGSTAATTTNVVRFVTTIPSHGSNEFGNLLQINTNGTVAKMYVYYRKGGKLQLRGFNVAGANIFDSGQIAVAADGQPMMVSVELTTSGGNVNWALRTILPGAINFNSQTTGSVAGSVSYVTTCVVDPQANVVPTSFGHLSVQNALIPLTTVSSRLNGHTSEHGIDRIIRLCNEQAFGMLAEFNETADHWGFEDGSVQGWTVTNGSGSVGNTNSLNGQNSNFEGGIGTWGNDGGAGACTVTADTTRQAHSGTGVLSMNATGAGNIYCTEANGAGGVIANGLATTPGTIVSASAWFKSLTVARTCRVAITFWTNAGAFISGVYPSGSSSSTGSWTQQVNSATAPATTAFSRVEAWVLSAGGAGEIHHVDDVQLGYQNACNIPGFPTEGTHALELVASGTGTLLTSSPIGTSGQPVIPGDIVAAAVDVLCVNGPANLVGSEVAFYNAAGTYLSSAYSPRLAMVSGQTQTFSAKGVAPATTAWFSVKFGDYDNAGNNSRILAGDHARVHPRMGPQTAKEVRHLIDEIVDLDQAILKEAREIWGFKFKTRISMLNQTPSLTLNYAAAQVGPSILTPVQDDLLTKNHVVVHRKKGSKVDLAVTSGSASVQEPPNGVGRYKKIVDLTAEEDAQLIAYATHLLGIGTDVNQRYPHVEVNLARSEVANLFSAAGGMEIGEYLQITNLPFWHPNATAKQLVIGYTETLSNYTWDIVFNCRPENPFEITNANIRRW